MKRLVYIIMLPLLLLTACVESLDDWNVDQKSAASVQAPTLFTNAMKNLIDQQNTPNVNLNNFRFFAQYWSSTTYLNEPRYNMTSRNYSQNMWNALYRDVLSDLDESKRLINANTSLNAGVKNNQLALIGVLEVYAWTVLVNTFGDVPYTEALQADNSLPKYDDAETIYNDLFVRLDAALALMTPAATSFGNADPIYSGSVAKWLKFGNSLKLRMGMTIADQNATKAKQVVEQAVSSLANVFESNADRARFPFLSANPNNNLVSQSLNPIFTSREDYVVANTVVDAMNSLNDPRRPFYFTQVGVEYKGGIYGFNNAYADYSHVSAKIIEPTFEALFMDYAEVEFLMAEAIERGFTVPGSASQHYDNAVTASILYWGGTAGDATTYLAQAAVNYATATGTYKEKIGFQKWIALYNRGWDGWTEWRRLDAPNLLPPSGPTIPDPLKIPVRMIYPLNEQTVNGAQWEIAADAIGGDTPDHKLFWDIN